MPYQPACQYSCLLNAREFGGIMAIIFQAPTPPPLSTLCTHSFNWVHVNKRNVARMTRIRKCGGWMSDFNVSGSLKIIGMPHPRNVSGGKYNNRMVDDEVRFL
ncbi:hypothetical protein CDAR_2761 [Caerostris darwini]|uniref:Uncharacterized protein n=1 Tax=Caerostris darwini TaxID=1538125 RepID=A0AAV4SWC1_9ARAC|nr:hypothetical protein CDAR_2721 [Caerostris darwini]GIY36752.1 hypothetical protein CDAR_2761 [Caerostris darwini]